MSWVVEMNSAEGMGIGTVLLGMLVVVLIFAVASKEWERYEKKNKEREGRGK